ncbi:polysaccharide deacetylase family protein [Peribacillus sp. NPDC097225]|uniref:polysaccharide deacetylase family protein n=1 Tax=Peribacillus sp. NPDC097225 TaxID=3364400 RepID=UPI00381927E2
MVKTLFIALSLIILFPASYNESQAATDSRAVYEKTGNVIWEVNTQEKIVAITFDDGPHPDYTPQILDLLAKYNAKATFFVAGNKVKSYPDVLKREIKEGHEIANHTYTHPYDRNITAHRLSSELDDTDKIIWDLARYKPSLYRPVGGFHNDTIINTAVNKGFKVVLWSWHQDPKDWARPPANKISNHIIKSLRPGDIILLHDWSDRPQTVRALETTLAYLYKNGYECVTVSELLYRSNLTLPEFFRVFPLK